MRKAVALLVVSVLIIGTMPIQAAEKGGAYPMFASCCLGPRIGLELNEGKEVKVVEWVSLVVGRWVSGLAQGLNNGIQGCFASCCLGPRVGEQLHERKIRTREWLQLVPIVGLVVWVMTGVDAYKGQTMMEVEQAENLKK